MFCDPLECWVQPSAYIEVIALFGGGLRDHFADFEIFLFRRTADLGDEFRRVDLHMLFEKVPHAARILQAIVGFDVAVIAHLVVPGGAVVIAFGFVIAGEEAVLEAKAFLDYVWRISECLHILPLNLIVGDAVIDDTQEECDVRAGPDRRVEIRDRSRTREARIDHDEPSAAVGFRFGHPFEAARMRLGGIAAHHDHKVGVLDISPGIRHCAAAERRSQTGHRRAVSNTRLVIENNHSGASDHLPGHKRRFVGCGGGGEEACRYPAIDRHAILIGGDEVLVAVVLHEPGDTVERVIPGYPLPFGGARLANLRILRARRRFHHVEQGRAFWTERAAIGGVIVIAFDMGNFGLFAFFQVAAAIHDDAACN